MPKLQLPLRRGNLLVLSTIPRSHYLERTLIRRVLWSLRQTGGDYKTPYEDRDHNCRIGHNHVRPGRLGQGFREVKLKSIVHSGMVLQRWLHRLRCRLYYQYDDKYIFFCTNPIHALLHIPQCIAHLGPPCHYWCFSMERYGGWVKRQVVHNRKKPIEALNNRVLREEQVGSSLVMPPKSQAVRAIVSLS